MLKMCLLLKDAACVINLVFFLSWPHLQKQPLKLNLKFGQMGHTSSSWVNRGHLQKRRLILLR